MPKGYSTNRHCPRCDKTVDWKAFHIDQNMCAECWRGVLATAVYEDPQAHHSKSRKKNTVDDVLEQIERILAKKKKDK